MEKEMSNTVRVVALLVALNIVIAGALFVVPGSAFAEPPSQSAGQNPVNAPPVNAPPVDAPPVNQPPDDAPPVDAPPENPGMSMFGDAPGQASILAH